MNVFIAVDRLLTKLFQSFPTQSARPFIGAMLALACFAMPEHARGDQIYVAVNNGFNGFSAIGEYNLNGTPMNTSLFTSLWQPQQMVVSGTNLFVANGSSTGSIGEYSTSGTTVNGNLISGLNGINGLALSGTNLFVATVGNGTAGNGAVGLYSTSGTTVNSNLITGLTYPTSIAISGTNLFIGSYANGTNEGTIGEYTMAGATVNSNLITGLNFPLGIAISGTNLFVINDNGTYVSEYTTSGAAVNTNLISGLAGGAESIAIYGSELFLNQRNGGFGGGGVGEYTLGPTPGTLVSSNLSFITGLYEPNSVLVDVTPPGLSLGFSPTLTITGTVGDTYTIQSSTNVGNPNAWITLTNLTLTQSVQVFIDTTVNTASPSNPQTFYQALPVQ